MEVVSRTAASLISRSLRSTAATVSWLLPEGLQINGLARGFRGNWLSEAFCRGKIHAGAQHVSEAVLDGHHV